MLTCLKDNIPLWSCYRCKGFPYINDCLVFRVFLPTLIIVTLVFFMRARNRCPAELIQSLRMLNEVPFADHVCSQISNTIWSRLGTYFIILLLLSVLWVGQSQYCGWNIHFSLMNMESIILILVFSVFELFNPLLHIKEISRTRNIFTHNLVYERAEKAVSTKALEHFLLATSGLIPPLYALALNNDPQVHTTVWNRLSVWNCYQKSFNARL